MVESCCSVTFLQTGETMHSVAKDMDIHSYRMPLGVTAGFVDRNCIDDENFRFFQYCAVQFSGNDSPLGEFFFHGRSE